MTESELGDGVLKRESNDAPVGQSENNEVPQVKIEDASHLDLNEKIKELTERNARNRELASQKQERNTKLLEQLERSLAESSHARSFFTENIVEEPVTPQADIVVEKPVEEQIAPPAAEETVAPAPQPQVDLVTESPAVEIPVEEKVAPQADVIAEKPVELAVEKEVPAEKIEAPKESLKNNTGLRVAINLLFYVIVIVIVGSVIISAMEHISSEPFEIFGYTLQRIGSENIVHDFPENTLIITSNNNVVFNSYSWGRILAFFEQSLTFKILVATILLIGLSAAKEVLVDRLSKRSPSTD